MVVWYFGEGGSSKEGVVPFPAKNIFSGKYSRGSKPRKCCSLSLESSGNYFVIQVGREGAFLLP